MSLKEANKQIDEIISIIFIPSIPDLYHNWEEGGNIFREYSFIRGNEEYQKRVQNEELPVLSLGKIQDFRSLKSTIEGKLKDRREYLTQNYYSFAAQSIRHWLHEHLQGFYPPGVRKKDINNPFNDEVKYELISKLGLPLQDIYAGITLGAGIKTFKSRVENDNLIDTEFDIYGNNGRVHFNLLKLVQKLEDGIERIQPFIFESIDLYFKYLAVVSQINEWQSNVLFDSLKNEDKRSTNDRIINLAIKPLRRKNKERAREFMKLYATQKNHNPHYNPSDFVEAIDWVEPTPNTQKDWMEKFDKAEKTLSISN